MKLISKLLINAFVIFSLCSLHLYGQRQTSSDEMQAALSTMHKSYEGLVEIQKRLATNKKQLEAVGIEIHAAIGKEKAIAEEGRLQGEQVVILNDLKKQEAKLKKDFDFYLNSIKWITNLTAKAKQVYQKIDEISGINESNKKRALQAINNGIDELNGQLSGVNPKMIDEIAVHVKAGRPMEFIKDKILKNVDHDVDEAVVDALIDIVIDATSNAMGEDALANKVDKPMGKLMRLVKIIRVFDGDKEDLSYLVDALDLASDLPGKNFLLYSYYIKIQKLIVEHIIELIGILKIEKAKTNLNVLPGILIQYGSERIQGNYKKWTGSGLVASEIFGKIPPEPYLKFKENKETFLAGSDVIVAFEGSYKWVKHYNDISKGWGWIGLVPSKTEHGSSDAADKVDLQYYYIPSEYGELSFKAPDESGSYDIRMFDRDPGPFRGDGKEVASITFKVVNKGDLKISAFDHDGKEVDYFARILQDGWLITVREGVGLEAELPPGKYTVLITVDDQDFKKVVNIYDNQKEFIEIHLKGDNENKKEEEEEKKEEEEVVYLTPSMPNWANGVLYNSNDGNCSLSGEYLVFMSAGQRGSGRFLNRETDEFSQFVAVPPGKKLEVAVPNDIVFIRVFSIKVLPEDLSTVPQSTISHGSMSNLVDGWWYQAGCNNGTKPKSRCDDGTGSGPNPSFSCNTRGGN